MSGIGDWLEFWARYGPRRPALLFEDRVETWGELADRAGRIAAGLQAIGIGKGDRVAVLMRNAPEYYEVVFACARLGAVFVPLNPRLTGPELDEIAQSAEPAVLVTDASFAGVLGHLKHVVGPERTYFVGPAPEGGRPLADLMGHGAPGGAADVDMGDPLFLSYTSGTTGAPKGALLTHGNAEGVAVSVIACDGLTPEDRAAVTVPLAFTGAGITLGMPLLHAGGSLLIRQELDPEAVLDDIEHHGVTFVGLVPVILERMAASPTFEGRDLSGLRVAKSGGAPVPEDMLRLYQERGIGLVGAYGLTEGTGVNLQLPAHDGLRKLGFAGLPLLGQQARVVDDDGRDVPAGETGELVLAGACIMAGYYREPEATARTLRDGWLHTGDLAVVDDEGYFKIVDRQKDMLISGGLNVYPAEIERVLAGHPDVVEVAVIGVPDERWGEVAMACVVAERPLTLDDLVAFSADRLADFKRPRRLRLLDAPLPRGMSGKVLKRELREAILR